MKDYRQENKGSAPIIFLKRNEGLNTKESRLEKITPMIADGVGLHDKYKNC
ncbi:MAG: hypothetical protein P8P77_04140 [Crocinitomicaceae bacterium]|nr:hypothetical protein [Crocinitomicaceae bacterium]